MARGRTQGEARPGLDAAERFADSVPLSGKQLVGVVEKSSTELDKVAAILHVNLTQSPFARQLKGFVTPLVAESDTTKAASIYEDVNKRFGSQAWNLWLNWTIWDVASAPDVHGVMGPDLPDGSKPFPGLATGHPVSGMWISKG